MTLEALPVCSPTLTDVLPRVDVPWVLDRTLRLWQAEKGQCFRHHNAAAELAASFLVEAGLERVERIPVPADGRTTCLDRRMPLAWDVSHATLTVHSPAGLFADPVVADYERHPFHVVKGSVATPPGGVLTPLIGEQHLLGGGATRGAMVMLEAETRPRGAMLSALLDLGALGFVTDHISGRHESPDALPWLNACTEGAHWHAQDGDRPFIGFAVTPRTGDALRAAVRCGPVVVHVASDARRYSGEFHHVTGVIPGEDPREVWLMAHLYEPFPDDNAVGVAASAEVVRVLRGLLRDGLAPRPRFTLRLLFTMEMYGVAAYAHLRGVPLRDHVLGAINFDSPIGPSGCGTLYMATPGSPFFGDYLLEQLVDEVHILSRPERIAVHETGGYADELFLNDPAVGLSTTWLLGDYYLHHNSRQTMDGLCPESLALHIAFYATFLARLLSLRAERRTEVLASALALACRRVRAEGEDIWNRFQTADERERGRIRRRSGSWIRWRAERESDRLRDARRVFDGAEPTAQLAELAREAQLAADELEGRLVSAATGPAPPPEPDPLRDETAAGIVPRRLAPVPPHDQADVPLGERADLIGNVIYGPLAPLLARMDGRRNLRDLVEYVEWLSGAPLGPDAVRGCVRGVEHLGEHGALAVVHARSVNRGHIAAALRQAGLGAGDLVLVHSSLSALGHVEGGADAVLGALLEVLGPTGTLLLPTFTNSVFYCDGEWIARVRSRPFDAHSPETWVGQVPSTFLRRGAAGGVRRSVHPTHSVAGCGPLAAACLDGHREDDPPTGRSSPFGRLTELGGRMLWLGADLGATTFFHFLEDEAGLPYLKTALAQVRRADGSVETVFVPRWLPGHREYYRRRGEEGRFYRRLIEEGLTIHRATLGQGEVHLIDARQMFDLGMAALQADPALPLCESVECLFCARWRTDGSPLGTIWPSSFGKSIV